MGCVFPAGHSKTKHGAQKTWVLAEHVYWYTGCLCRPIGITMFRFTQGDKVCPHPTVAHDTALCMPSRETWLHSLETGNLFNQVPVPERVRPGVWVTAGAARGQILTQGPAQQDWALRTTCPRFAKFSMRNSLGKGKDHNYVKVPILKSEQ